MVVVVCVFVRPAVFEQVLGVRVWRAEKGATRRWLRTVVGFLAVREWREVGTLLRRAAIVCPEGVLE